jgi:hypothetical protein
MKRFLLIAAALIIVILVVVRFIEIRRAWNSQPPAVKVAAVALEQRMEANLRKHDLVRYPNGQLALVETLHVEYHAVQLRNCGHLEIYLIDFTTLARKGVVLIPRSAPSYRDSAVECLDHE